MTQANPAAPQGPRRSPSTAAHTPTLITSSNWEAIAEQRGYPQQWRKHLADYVTDHKLQASVAEIAELFRLADDGQTILRRKTDKPVKTFNKGRYNQVSEWTRGKKRNFSVSRMTFALHHGWIAQQIDHVNRDRFDDRIENLRPANPSQNAINKVGNGRRRCDPTLGSCIYRGTEKRARVNDGKFFWVRICSEGKPDDWLGPFKTHEDAQAARDEEQTRRHGAYWPKRYSRISSAPPGVQSRKGTRREIASGTKINRKGKPIEGQGH